MESHLIDILVCPLCKGRLHYDRPAQELVCQADKLAFPVRDGIPVMLEGEARSLGGTPPQATGADAAAPEQASRPDGGA